MSRYHGSVMHGGIAHSWAGAPSPHDSAMLEELNFVRREAQAEANQAYEDWRRLRSRDAYAVYRAAQDRADAGQDDLALVTERTLLDIQRVSDSPSKALDPRPAEFDVDLATIDARFVDTRRGEPNAKVRLVLSIDGEDAKRLEGIAAARGEKLSDVIAGLLRDAESQAG